MSPLSRVVVAWESSDLWHERRSGSFNTNATWAWIWGRVFCLFNPRGAVHVELLEAP